MLENISHCHINDRAGDATTTRKEMQLQIICNLVVYLYLIYENDNKPTNAIYVFVAGHCKKGGWGGDASLLVARQLPRWEQQQQQQRGSILCNAA